MSDHHSGTPKSEIDPSIVQLFCEVGAYERHFNGIQSEYRKMASQWLLAAFGAIGFLLYSEGLTSPDGLPLSFIASAVALAASIGVLLLWQLDIHVYHKLLLACFHAGRALERGTKQLPPIRRRMAFSAASVRYGMTWFYMGSLSVMTLTGLGIVWGLPPQTASAIVIPSVPVFVTAGFGVVFLTGLCFMCQGVGCFRRQGNNPGADGEASDANTLNQADSR